MATQRSKKSGSHSRSSGSSQHGRGASAHHGGSSAKSRASTQHGRQSGSKSGESRSARSAGNRRRAPQASQSNQGGGGGEGVAGGNAGGMKAAGSKAVDSVKQHPIASAVIGAGVAGLTLLAVKAAKNLSSGRSDDEESSNQGEGENPEMSQRGGEEDQSEESSGEPSGQQEEGDEDDEGEGEEDDDDEDSGGAESEGDQGFLSRARGALGRGTSSVGHGLEQGYEYSKETLGNLWENHPLAVGAGILALGVAAGMLVPATRAEKKIFRSGTGKLTDRLKNAGRELLQQGGELVGSVVSETGTAIRQEAEREGLTPDKLARKVRRIAGRVKDVISETSETA